MCSWQAASWGSPAGGKLTWHSAVPCAFKRQPAKSRQTHSDTIRTLCCLTAGFLLRKRAPADQRYKPTQISRNNSKQVLFPDRQTAVVFSDLRSLLSAQHPRAYSTIHHCTIYSQWQRSVPKQEVVYPLSPYHQIEVRFTSSCPDFWSLVIHCH